LLVTDWKREGEDDHEEALAFDPSVPADISEAAYDAVGILSPPPSIWVATSADACTRAPAVASRAGAADTC
jgi:hypothetical protein